jgi:hypothetical protein
MRISTAFIVLFLISSCAVRTVKPPQKKKFTSQVSRPFTNDNFLRKLLKKEVSRKGKYSTVTNEDITTERYVRGDGETILTLEKDELRTEVEKSKSGKVLTRTWQDGKLTTLTISGTKRTTMVLLDEEEKFVHKIVTEKGSPDASCFRYEGRKPVPMESSDCLGLIPGF